MKSAPLNAQNLSKLEIIKIQFDKQNNFANKKINELKIKRDEYIKSLKE